MRTLAERDALVLEHMPLVKRLQVRYYPTPKRHDQEDLQQDGYLALVRSAERWSPVVGVTFKNYVCPRILGAMADYFRRVDGWTRNPATRHTMLSLSDSSCHQPFEDPALAVVPLAIDLERAMATLKPRDQALIDHIIIRDRPDIEIARAEHVTRSGISWRLTAVRAKLQAALC